MKKKKVFLGICLGCLFFLFVEEASYRFQPESIVRQSHLADFIYRLRAVFTRECNESLKYSYSADSSCFEHSLRPQGRVISEKFRAHEKIFSSALDHGDFLR